MTCEFECPARYELFLKNCRTTRRRSIKIPILRGFYTTPLLSAIFRRYIRSHCKGHLSLNSKFCTPYFLSPLPPPPLKLRTFHASGRERNGICTDFTRKLKNKITNKMNSKNNYDTNCFHFPKRNKFRYGQLPLKI